MREMLVGCSFSLRAKLSCNYSDLDVDLKLYPSSPVLQIQEVQSCYNKQLVLKIFISTNIAINRQTDRLFALDHCHTKKLIIITV